MSERLIEKIDRLGAEAGVETMTPEIRRFALLVRQDTVAQWPDFTAQQRESYQKGHNDGVAHHKQAVKAAQPEQKQIGIREIRVTETVKPEQEIVAWMRPSKDGYDSAFRDHSTVVRCTGNTWTGWVPLYTTTPKREWIGLTDKQRLEIADDSASYRMVLATEAKLKEKNT